jgi:peptidoglycan hydrolase-like protein with peptidoglycan-binding domain
VLNGRATLQRGSQGEEVSIVQKALIDLGESMPAGEDGSFGAQSQAAIIHYQSTRGLSADGIFGRNTMEHLDTDIVAFDAPTPETGVLRTLCFWINRPVKSFCNALSHIFCL